MTTLVNEYTFVMRVADSMVSLKATTRTVYKYLKAEWLAKGRESGI